MKTEEIGAVVFPKFFSNLAIRTYFIILLIIAAFSFTNISPFLWLTFSTLTVLLFFINVYRLPIKWGKLSDAYFRKKLFKIALIIRIISILFFYFFFTYMNGNSFEFDAGDAFFYDETGKFMSDYFMSGKIDAFAELQKYMVISDTGFPIYLGVIYSIFFKSILLARLLNAFFGAWLCVIIFDLVKRNFDSKVAKLAGIMMMIMPVLIYYSSLHLKETLMIFLLFVFINLADIIVKSKKINYYQILFLILSGSSLFLFRTVLGVCAIVSIISYLIFANQRITGIKRRLIIGFWMIGMLIFLLATSVRQDINTYIADGSTNQEQKVASVSNAQGNRLAKYGSKSLLFPMLIAAPFPTFVNTDQKNIMMLGGSIFIRNIYAFFVILALIVFYKRKLFSKHVLILSFLFSYLVVLGFSGFVLSDRFHLPIVPILVILAAYGVSQVNFKNFRFFNLYLILIGLIIIGWNWFKLAGRDII
ncbi:MAG: hypothetical protein ACK5B9_11030 [Flavobacteriia bacterium]|jgi:4-amino-4-deoxy-L-arabinose transferase-like glycosyltransferase